MMKSFNLFLLVILTFAMISITNCKKDPSITSVDPTVIPVDKLYHIEPSAQRVGEPTTGQSYLLNGDYVDSGIPFDIFKNFYGTSDEDLDRVGLNQDVDYSFNAFTSSNGVDLVSPNCFQCHASTLNGELIIGLGNTEADFTGNQSGSSILLDQLVESTYGLNSPEWEAYFPFTRAIKATTSELQTETVGLNPADKLAALLAAHRDPVSLEWIDEDQLGVPSEVIPTDVPPWWNLKKKNSMFYTGVGRGDFARISMASSVLTIKDTIKAREIDNQFADVIAYINTLEAPAYPYPVNNAMIAHGEDLFLNNCSSCHGEYGDNETYPNLLVDLDLIQTDSMLVYANFGFGEFTDWYNSSWFGQGQHAGKLVAERGYIAPPLDGVWATAPYLHNGSVPDMRSLLDSKSRPAYWKRTYTSSQGDEENIGLTYEVMNNKQDKFTYDTSIPGYSNAGHTFGDHFNDTERRAIIEYLKSI